MSSAADPTALFLSAIRQCHLLSADQLAALLPDARFVRVPGDHGTAFGAPELTAAIAAFLAER